MENPTSQPGVPLDAAGRPWAVAPADAASPLVLALDVGSTATRGALYDAHGRPVGKRVKLPHRLTTGPDGTSEIDPDQVLAEVGTVIDRLTRPGGPALGNLIGGVALDTFASSFLAIDDAGNPLTPALSYADGRPHTHVADLRAEIAEAELHQLVGTRFHASYWPARLRWLQAEYPEITARARRYLSLGDYVLWRLTGTLATGTASAAWTGMVDLRSADWSDRALEIARVGRGAVPPVLDPDTPLALDAAGRAAVAQRWPALVDAVWFAPIPDGLAANVGLGAGNERTIGGSAATSGALRLLVADLPTRLPSGLWCYRVSRERAIVGGALNDVGRAISWATGALALGSEPAAALRQALAAPPREATPLVLPFFTGERATGWAANARAVFTGVGAATSGSDTARGVVEGIAISYDRVLAQLRQLAPEADALHMGGSVATEYPEALQILADVLQLPVTPVTIKRSTLLGTALLALDTVAPGVQRISPQHAAPLTPDAAHAPYYGERVERFESVYRALFA